MTRILISSIYMRSIKNSVYDVKDLTELSLLNYQECPCSKLLIEGIAKIAFRLFQTFVLGC